MSAAAVCKRFFAQWLDPHAPQRLQAKHRSEEAGTTFPSLFARVSAVEALWVDTHRWIIRPHRGW